MHTATALGRRRHARRARSREWLAVLSLAGCGARLEPAPAGELCDVLATEVGPRGTPSLVIAGFRADRLVFLGARGVADPITGRAATTDTVYMFFSITKLFTATAVMILVDEGRVELDRPLDDYLPSLPIANPHDTPLTVRHLLDHSSGLPNPPVWKFAHLHDRPRPSATQLLDTLLADGVRLEAEPGTRDRYNNLAYLILGRLIEDASGQPYEEFVRSRILEPLDMQHTDFVYRDDMLPHAAIGVVERNSIYHRLFRRVAGPELFGPEVEQWATAQLYLVDGAAYAGLVGTAPDLARFASMHLAGGIFDGQRILSEASVRAMQQVQHTPRDKALSHTLGWHTDVIGGERYFNHMGRGGGFRPAVRIYPGLGFGIVVLANKTDFDPRPITQRVPIEGEAAEGCGD